MVRRKNQFALLIIDNFESILRHLHVLEDIYMRADPYDFFDFFNLRKHLRHNQSVHAYHS